MNSTNTKVSIRKARSSDARAMKACVDAAYRHYVPMLGKPPGPMLNDFSEVIRQSGAFVIGGEGQVIAVLVLIPERSGMLPDNVALHPEHQGQGIGRRLIQFADTQSEKREYPHLVLYTHACMTENIEMYKAFGYIEHEHKWVHGYNRVYMRKFLDRNHRAVRSG